MHNDIKSVLYSEKELDEICTRIAKQINKDYEGKNLALVVVLKGAVTFAADLMRKLDVKVNLDFITVSSYVGTESTGKINIVKDVKKDLSDTNVILVEDIFDTGRTLSFLVQHMKDKGAKSVEICTLFHKPARQVVEVDLKYVGTTIPDEFIVGYGLDYNEIYRNLPYVGVLKPEVYGG